MTTPDNTDMTPAEFRARMAAGIPCEIVTSREEYLARLDEMAGILGPDWCEGLDTVDWVRRQRDEKARDDMVDRWHDTGGAPDGQLVELHEYLGMTEDQYGEWLRDPTSWKPR